MDDKRSFATALESCVDNAALIALLKECSPPEALEYVQSKLSEVSTAMRQLVAQLSGIPAALLSSDSLDVLTLMREVLDHLDAAAAALDVSPEAQFLLAVQTVCSVVDDLGEVAPSMLEEFGVPASCDSGTHLPNVCGDEGAQACITALDSAREWQQASDGDRQEISAQLQGCLANDNFITPMRMCAPADVLEYAVLELNEVAAALAADPAGSEMKTLLGNLAAALAPPASSASTSAAPGTTPPEVNEYSLLLQQACDAVEPLLLLPDDLPAAAEGVAEFLALLGIGPACDGVYVLRQGAQPPASPPRAPR